MKLREHADAVEEALIAFFARSVKEESDAEVLSNARVSAYYITELTKRWAERKYYEKQHGKELTIEEAIERSAEATTKFFARKERRRAPREMREALKENADLLAFLDGEEEKQPEKPEPDVQSDNHDEQSHDKDDELEKESEAVPNEDNPTHSGGPGPVSEEKP